jgi:D-alanine-D-alanine ligase
MNDWLQRLSEPNSIRTLYLAQYAPHPLLLTKLPYADDGGYPGYHYNVYKSLIHLGLEVHPSCQPSSLLLTCGRIDYVYSLLNRMPLRDSEVLVSAVCEYLGVPYLGAPPTVRALAQDKLLFKIAAQTIGIPTPLGKVYRSDDASAEEPPPFPPPYFVKERDGAGSEDISEKNLATNWSAALEVVQQIRGTNKDAIVEQYCDGIDITVPVVGASPYQVLPPIRPLSDAPGDILTHSLKLDDHLGYELANLNRDLRETLDNHIEKIWSLTGPMDYFRADYRLNPADNSLHILEINICCHLEEQSAFSLAASEIGVTYPQLLEHIIAYSLTRQRRRRKQLHWVL